MLKRNTKPQTPPKMMGFVSSLGTTESRAFSPILLAGGFAHGVKWCPFTMLTAPGIPQAACGFGDLPAKNGNVTI
jgi:hypothetical protein